MVQGFETEYVLLFSSFLCKKLKFFLRKNIFFTFKLDEIVAATCVYEGSKEEVENQERKLAKIAERMNGVCGGAHNGEYGYRLTFAIAYLRVRFFFLVS